jgi:hypothetical protein
MSDSPIAILTGGCQCGACRYALTAAPERVHFCHCRNCLPTPLVTRSRRRTGSHETPRWREQDSNPRSPVGMAFSRQFRSSQREGDPRDAENTDNVINM